MFDEGIFRDCLKQYKEDFEKITTQMLFIKVGYDEIVTVLDRIIESKTFVS